MGVQPDEGKPAAPAESSTPDDDGTTSIDDDRSLTLRRGVERSSSEPGTVDLDASHETLVLELAARNVIRRSCQARPMTRPARGRGPSFAAGRSARAGARGDTDSSGQRRSPGRPRGP